MPFHRRALEPIAAGFKGSLVSADISEIEAWHPDALVVADGPPIPLLREYCDSHNVLLVGLQHGSATRYMAPEPEYRLVDYFCGSDWDIRRFAGKGVTPRRGFLLTGNPWVDEVFTVPRRELCKDAPTMLFAPTYNPEITAARFFEGKLVDLVRSVYPDSRIIIKPHPAIVQYDNPYVVEYRPMFQAWVEDWRRMADKYPKVEFIDDSEVPISKFFPDADILISDGSSLIFEFMALDRPILLYTSQEKIGIWEYDPEALGNCWRDVGAEFSTEEEFTAALKDAFSTHATVHSARQREHTEELYGGFQDGRSAGRVIQAIRDLPYLDVLIVTEDCEGFVGDFIANLRNILANCRIHIADSGSTDGALDIIRKLDVQSVAKYDKQAAGSAILNAFFKKSVAKHILVIDCSPDRALQCANFISDSLQLMAEDTALAAAGRVRRVHSAAEINEYVESNYCIFDREKILEVGGFSDSDADLSARIASRGYKIHSAWDEEPVARFEQGFYGDEGGARWMSDEAVITVGRSVACTCACSPVQLRFRAACGKREYYKQFPFSLRIFVGDDLAQEVRFESGRQVVSVELRLDGNRQQIRLISEEAYVPAELGIGSDPRRLSVLVSNVEVSEIGDHSKQPAGEPRIGDPFEGIEKPARLIAFYLPQFHPIPENDEWWGKGFTEWTNVRKAKPLFEGHYQPHVPADLGYYDLRSPETRKAQAELAKSYGIEGFCYWHYWFNGKRLLETPFNEVLESGELDFPFCLAWANEDWTRTWDGRSSEILQKQDYGGEADDTAHFQWLLKAFADQRYISVDGKPLFLIYRPADLPDASSTASLWRKLAADAGLPGLFLVAIRTCFDSTESNWVERGFDAELVFQPSFQKLFHDYELGKLDVSVLRLPRASDQDVAEVAGQDDEQDVVISYNDAWPSMAGAVADQDNCFSCVLPSWDNSPRRRKAVFILKDSSPEAYGKWLKLEIERTSERAPDRRIVFINAWNEWGEGNYLEPDEGFGRGYLEATRRALTSEAISQLHASGRSDEAISRLEEYLSLDPDYAQGHNDLGVLYCEKGDVDKAVFHLGNALSLDESDCTARKNLADLYLALGRAEEASQLYRKILADNPDDVETLLGMANLCSQTGRWNDASLLYTKALGLDPTNAEAREKLNELGRVVQDSAPVRQVAYENETLSVGESVRGRRMANLPTVHTSLSEVCAPLRQSHPPASSEDGWRGTCPICGMDVEFAVTNPSNLRESLVCPGCGSISRDRTLVCALGAVLGETEALRSWKPDRNRRIFEASSFRGHAKFMPKLCDHYNTRYVPEKMQGQYDNRKYADLQQMPYDDEFFDVIMTSDVFEHVRLYQQALYEVYRVLKPGGVMLLQVPFHPDGETVTRAQPDGDKDVFLMEPLYHAEDTLVYRVYGRDFLAELQDAGFEVECVEAEMPHFGIPGQSIIVCRKPAIESTCEKCKASIVIPVFNNLALTRNCLDAIFCNTQDVNYEIIVVDNASTDGTTDYLKGIESDRIRCIFNSENKGFVEACNAGAGLASGDYLLFLNNDTEVQPGWLSSLVGFAEATPDCGAVGLKLVYPTGRLQEAGGIIFSDGSGWNYGRGMDPSDPRFNFVREVDYCSGAALMVRKVLWDQIGGFDLRYAPAYYEDTDLCFEIRKRGYKVYYQPKSTVVHHEGQTAGRDLQSGFKKYQRANRAKFVQKWASELRNQYQSRHSNVPRASNRQTTKSILVVDAFLPTFDRASGSLRLFNILKMLRQMNFHVTFVARNGSMEDRYRPILEDVGIEVYAWDVQGMRAAGYRVTSAAPIDYENLFRERQHDYALIEFWHLAEHYLPLVRRLSPRTQVIIDTVDIHFLRQMREAELKESEEIRQKALYHKRRELAVYQKADRLWVVTPQDKEAIEDSVGGVPIDIVPNVHAQVTAVKEFDKTSDLLFVGNFSHPPNEDAVLYFWKDVFPLILKDLPDVRLYVVGNNPPDSVKALASDRIIVTGYVQDLSPYLLQARISVSPLRYGAGMKGKVGEALSWGLPVVTTTIGAEGMELDDGRDALIADTAEQFAAKVVRLYNDCKLWTRLSGNGRSKVEAQWSPEAVKQRLETIFTGAEEKLVSIVILAHNQLPYTKQCLDSIRQHTTVPYELIIVDNGSTDGTAEYLTEFGERWRESAAQAGDSKSDRCRAVKVLRHDRNLGYAAGNNSGIAAADGSHILLLNNDVVVTPGWLGRLTRFAEWDPRIGIVGPMSNYVSGPQLVREFSYDSASLEGLDEFASRWAKERAGESVVFPRVVGFCMLIKRNVIERIGGLDTRFGLGNFEDDDFSIRAAIAGFRSAIAVDCFIHHFGSRTFIGERIDYKESLLRNWAIFKEKWGLPADLQYGASYDMPKLVRQSFDPEQHYCPLPADSRKEPVQDGKRWFAAPQWKEVATWRPIVERYVRSQAPDGESLLQLYAGHRTGSDSQEAYRQVAEFLQKLGVDSEKCPDIEVTAKLPEAQTVLIILTGGLLDNELQLRFPGRCVHLDEWRRAA